MVKSNTICYDLALLPDGLGVEYMIGIMKTEKIIFYDSKLTDKKPYIINEDEEFNKILLDISSIEGKARYDEIMKLKQQEDGK